MTPNIFDINSNNKVCSVESYLYEIDALYKLICSNMNYSNFFPPYSCKLWFRGVKSTKYHLEATIMRERNVLSNKIKLNTKFETLYISKFKSKAIPFLSTIPYYSTIGGLPSYWGWLFLARHYGIPTRIMDWTRNALVGLLFAIAGNLTPEEKEEDSAVWCLNPIKLNELFHFSDYYKEGYIPNVEEKIVFDLFGPEACNKCAVKNIKPCAVIGPMNNSNIIAQNGAFTIFPCDSDIVPLDKLEDSHDYLYRIIIAKDSRKYIIEQLRRYGITEPSLYPSISKIIDEIDAEGF